MCISFSTGAVVRSFVVRGALLLLMLSSHGVPCAVANETITTRAEAELSFAVSAAHLVQVWHFLRKELPRAAFVRERGISTVVSVEQFQDEYFDTAERELLRRWIGLRHRRRVGEGGAQKELVQLKITPQELVGGAPAERQEVKFALADGYIAKSSLPERIRRADQERFDRTLRELGLDPADLRYLVTVRQERRRVYFRKNGEQLLTVTMDIATVPSVRGVVQDVTVEFEISELALTAARAQRDALREAALISLQQSAISFVAPHLKSFGVWQPWQQPKVVSLLAKRDQREGVVGRVIRRGTILWIALGILGMVWIVDRLQKRKDRYGC